MLNEAPKINLTDRENIKRVVRRYRRDQLRGYLYSKFPVLLGAGAYATQSYIGPKVHQLKTNMILRDIEKRNRKYAKRRAKMDKKLGIYEGWKADFFGDKVKPLLMKNKKMSKAFHKYGPKAQKAVDFYYGNKDRMGQHLVSFAKERPLTAAALSIAGSIAAKTAIDVGSHWLSHKMKMRDPNYAEQTHRNADLYRQRRRGYRFYEAADGLESHASPLTRGVANKGHKNMAHKKHHAHVSILRGMAIDKVNSTGLAGKKFQAGGTNQLGTKKTQQNADIMTLDNIIEDTSDRIYEGAIGKALKWGLILGGASWLAHRRRKYDENKIWNKTGQPFLSYEVGRGLDKAKSLYDKHLKVVTDPHIEKANKKFEKVKKELGREVPTPKDVKLSPAELNKLRYTREQAKHGPHKRQPMNYEDTISQRANNIYELAPLLAAGATALRAAAPTLLRSAGKAAAAEVGTSVAKKALTKKSRREDIIDTTSDAVYEAWAGIVKSAAKAGITKDSVKTALKSSTAKKMYQKAGEGAATQIGTSIGARIGGRIERGSYRSQKKQAKRNRRLNRIDGGRRWSSYDPEYNLSEDVAPAARSPFEINRVKNAKDWYHYQRNAYIDAAIQKAKQVARIRKPNEQKIYGRNTAQNGQVSEASFETPEVSKLIKYGAIGIAGVGATKYLWDRRSLKARRKLHAKKANKHRRHYNRHAAYVHYADARMGAKAQYRQSMRENLTEMGYLKAGELVRDFHLKPTAKIGKRIAATAVGPLQKALGKKEVPSQWWQPLKYEGVQEAEDRTARIQRELRKQKDREAAKKTIDRLMKERREKKKAG